jgi:hypothetical protein
MEKQSNTQQGWWHARFRIKWPEGEEPSWHIDLLLAHRLIAPVLHLFGREISLWRFHRRAFRDDEGHQFSFIFYADPGVADRVFAVLQSNAMLKKMKRSRLVIQDVYDNTNRILAPDIPDTSDGNWDPVVRRSWPFFIMGVCRMWLTMVEEIAGEIPDQKPQTLRQLIPRYRSVDGAIKALWREQGCHSLLHHLNALFGYEPVIIREAHLRRF